MDAGHTAADHHFASTVSSLVLDVGHKPTPSTSNWQTKATNVLGNLDTVHPCMNTSENAFHLTRSVEAQFKKLAMRIWQAIYPVLAFWASKN